MFDMKMYAATKDNPGGPVFLTEELSPLSPQYLANDDIIDDRPLTLGRVIGGIISLGLLVATGAYLFAAF